MRIELEFRVPIPGRVDASPLQPDMILRSDQKKLDRIPLFCGDRSVLLSEIAVIHGDAGKMDEIIFSGDTQKLIRIGYLLKSGKLVVNGDAGDELGAGMSGGWIYAIGSAGDYCGANVIANTPGMQGGMIFVRGNAGAYAGAGMRRGMLIIMGDAGRYVGTRMAAGTILCGGTLGEYPGLGMKRGSIVTQTTRGLLSGFFPSGKADEEWLRISFSEIRRAGMNFPSQWLYASPSRFTGDHLEMGKGEILVYDQLE